MFNDLSDRFSLAPYAYLCDEDGVQWSAINLLNSVHRVGKQDETWQIESVNLTEDDDDVVVTVSSSSSAWVRHTTKLRCTAETIELTVSVEGTGRISDVTLLGGEATLSNGACGAFRSSIGFAGVLVPTPTEPVQLVRPSRSAAALGVVGDSNPGRLNGIFSPPPLALGFSRQSPTGATDVPTGAWFALSLRAPVEELNFTTMRYEPVDGGFWIRLNYDGRSVIDGAWTSPAVVLRAAASGWDVLTDYRDDLVLNGCAPATAPHQETWWRQPLFCGWGAQCARVTHQLHAAGKPLALDPVSDSEPETLTEEDAVVWSAPSYARQEVYDEFLARLDANGLWPGTIVLDDRWQEEYGTAMPDQEHWPDLRGWIADRHAAGQKVLLWWKAWDPQGLPPEECILDAAGRPIAVDPANEAYRERLEGIVRYLISTDGLDADGFKVDFTQRAPSGQSVSGSDGAWGIAALHLLLGTLYRATKSAKADALVVCHAVHPSFADVCDMVRLNDVLRYDVFGDAVSAVDQMVFRQQIATRTLPDHGIDTDQWPMSSRAEWLDYADLQGSLGVPALYYLESIDRSGEKITSADLERVSVAWARYRKTQL